MVLAVVGTLILATVLAAVFGRAVKHYTSLPAGRNTAAIVFFGVIVGACVVGLTRGMRLTDGEDRSPEGPGADPLLDRLGELRRQLSESAKLLPALQAELELRTAALATLQEEAARYQQLAALHQEQAAAVQRLVEQTIAAGNAQSQRQSQRQQWGFWIAAVMVSVPVGAIGNYLYAWLHR